MHTAWDDKILIRDSHVPNVRFSEQTLFCSLSPAELHESVLDWDTRRKNKGNNARNDSNDKNNPPKILINQEWVGSGAFYHTHIYAYEHGIFATNEEAYTYARELLHRV
jgi:hypothetical protein